MTDNTDLTAESMMATGQGPIVAVHSNGLGADSDNDKNTNNNNDEPRGAGSGAFKHDEQKDTVNVQTLGRKKSIRKRLKEFVKGPPKATCTHPSYPDPSCPGPSYPDPSYPDIRDDRLRTAKSVGQLQGEKNLGVFATLRNIIKRKKSRTAVINPLDRTEEHGSLNQTEIDDIYIPNEPNSLFGCGVCILVTLFTGDLKGYQTDHRCLKELFEDMRYTIFEGKNYSQSELKNFLEDTCLKIEGSETKFDRLVCVVSSHGQKEGFLTCKDRSGQIEELRDPTDLHSNPLITPFDDVISFFKHDKLTKLKNHPKLLLFQCCKGSDVVRVAAAPTITNAKSRLKDEEAYRQPKVPVDADFEICFASTKNNKSFVEDLNGSWFTQAVVQTFKNCRRRYHVHDMVTTVHRVVAEKRRAYKHRIENQNTGVLEEMSETAVQIPCTYSTLRRQFWLEHDVYASTTVKNNNTYCNYKDLDDNMV